MLEGGANRRSTAPSTTLSMSWARRIGRRCPGRSTEREHVEPSATDPRRADFDQRRGGERTGVAKGRPVPGDRRDPPGETRVGRTRDVHRAAGDTDSGALPRSTLNLSIVAAIPDPGPEPDTLDVVESHARLTELAQLGETIAAPLTASVPPVVAATLDDEPQLAARVRTALSGDEVLTLPESELDPSSAVAAGLVEAFARELRRGGGLAPTSASVHGDPSRRMAHECATQRGRCVDVAGSRRAARRRPVRSLPLVREQPERHHPHGPDGSHVAGRRGAVRGRRARAQRHRSDQPPARDRSRRRRDTR